MDETLVAGIREAVRERRLMIGRYAARRMEGRAIARAAVETALRGPLHLVENYPDDARGPSCLLLGYADEQPLHLCVTYPAGVPHHGL
jgi:hypothetical protein